MNTEKKSLEDLSTKGTELLVENGQLKDPGLKNILTSPFLSKIQQHKTKGMKILPDRTDIFPLSYGQRALWFFSQSVQEGAFYNVVLTFRINSKISVPALQGAFQELVDRHPSLRTTFSIYNGEPFQRIHRYQKVCFEEIAASGFTWNKLKNKIFLTYKRPFNLERGPLIRVNLFSCSEEDHVLLVTMHQIIFDAWSSLILLDELRILYSAQKAGSNAFLLPPDKSYCDYVQWQAKMLTSSKGKQFWSYWHEKLAGELPKLNLPTNRSRAAVQSFQSDTYSFELDKELTLKVKALTKAEGKTIYMTLLAAFYILLHNYTSQEDIIVGSLAPGRTQTEFNRTIGYFENPMVLRQNISRNLTFKMFLTQLHQTVVDALKHQDYPFLLLAEQLQSSHDPSLSQLFRVMFNLSEIEDYADIIEPSQKRSCIKWDDLDLGFFEIPQKEYPVDLTLEMREVGGFLYGTFKYCKDLFDKTTIIRMAEHFQILLNEIVADPNQCLSEYPC